MTQNTDPSGKATSFAYDPAQDLTQVTDALGGVTSYTYGAGRDGKLLQKVVDANGHATTFGYDVLGRLTSVTNALGKTKTYAYDAKGNLTSFNNMRGQTISYAYDSLDRLVTKTLPEGTVGYEYDSAGNLTKVTNYIGSIVQMSYDALNRVTQSVQTLPGGYTATIGYTYDAAGNRTLMTAPWGNFAYTYDSLNRLASITNPQSEVFTFAYDSLGRRTRLTYPNGIATTYTYDAASQVTGITATRTADGVVVSSAAYTYDASGNRSSMTDWAGTHSYTYDNLHRLVSASHPAASMLPVLNETFSYDGVGNRTMDAVVTGYAYDAVNRLTANSSFSYTYDVDGNQASKKETATSNLTSYGYDSQNVLVGASVPDGTHWTYKYDALGRRVEKSSGTTSAQVTRFVYDGRNLLATVDGSGLLHVAFTHGLGVDEILSLRRTDGTEFSVHSDALGSVIVHANATGNAAEVIEYQAYGIPAYSAGQGAVATGSVSALGDSFAFTGREWDFERREYDFRGRQVYDPLTGRFGQEDPLGLTGGNNLYAYVENRPLIRTDRLGLITDTGWEPRTTGTPTESTGLSSCLATCSQKVLGIGGGLTTATSLAGAYPIEKGSSYFNSSPNTNVLRACGTALFGERKLPFQIPILETNRLWGALGRANILLSTGLISYDATSILLCTNACATGDRKSVYYP